jgi:sugar-specific transcriptional regulator TrmB
MDAYLKGRRKIWSSKNPDRLMAALREHETVLKTVLPKLHSFRHDADVKLPIRTYSGVEEIKQIMNDIIETKHPASALMSWDDWTQLLSKSFLDDFIEIRRRNFLRIRLLTPKTKMSLALKQRDAAELRITQFLPEDVDINNCNFIYDSKVAIISTNTKIPVGILIEDQDIHHTMEVFFENLWTRSGGMPNQFS